MTSGSSSHAAAPRSGFILALVIAGGALGVFARAALVIPISDTTSLVWATAGINALGSLALGVVVGSLGGRHPQARAFLGTGVLGGFTTYSAFAVQAVTTWTAQPWSAVALAAATVLAGMVGAVIGLFVGRRIADAPGEIEPPEAAE